jgi:predicted HicB family RNase H-like nuclease
MKNKPKSGAPKGNKNAVKDPEEKRSEKIEIRVTKTEKEKLKNKAEKENINLSEWILKKIN